MATINKPIPVRTHEGAPAYRAGPLEQLRRSVLACMLWERTFYEDGVDVGERILQNVIKVSDTEACAVATEARDSGIRHAPLLVAAAIVKSGRMQQVRSLLADICRRADDPGEFLAILRLLNGGELKTIPRQVKLGLGDAMRGFTEYQIAKYQNRGDFKPLDVLRLCHPKPTDDYQNDVWNALAGDDLEAPETWEVRFSRLGDDTELGKAIEKRGIWVSMLKKRELGALALVRNVRNMLDVGVDKSLINAALEDLTVEARRKVMPWQWISAAIENPTMEAELDAHMLASIERDKLPGSTVILVDVSGSMIGPWGKLSEKSDRDRCDAACGMAIHLRELCLDAQVWAFGSAMNPVPARRGMALRDAIKQSPTFNTGTNLGSAVANVPEADRLIVLTDEQSHERVGQPKADKAYMVNLGTYKNGVAYNGKWNHVNGFSAATVEYIVALETQ
jgi:hypothetical protein